MNAALDCLCPKVPPFQRDEASLALSRRKYSSMSVVQPIYIYVMKPWWSLFPGLGGNKEPPYADYEPQARTKTKGTSGPDHVKHCTPYKPTKEQRANGHNLMISGGDEPAKVKELRFGHQLAPSRRQYHCATESVSDAKTIFIIYY